MVICLAETKENMFNLNSSFLDKTITTWLSSKMIVTIKEALDLTKVPTKAAQINTNTKWWEAKT